MPWCVGDGFDGGPAVLRMFEENRLPWVRGSFVLAGLEVGGFTGSKYSTCDTVFSCRL